MPDTEQWADWCETDGDLTLCGTEMIEYSRESQGERWCFTHRMREEFFWIVMVPAGLSYYGPTAHMEGPTRDCTDLFPGWYRDAPDA